VNCKEFTEFLMAWLDGELPEAQRAVFEAHIRDCPPCLTFLDTYRDTIRLGKAVCLEDDASLHEVPESLVQAILASRRL
jgi:anti-sigma factor RsiW